MFPRGWHLGKILSERWGTPKEYAAYFGMLLTVSGRKEFHWWLEREKPDLYQLFKKELARGDR